MKTGFLKNVLIVFLVVLCVIQVGQVWYGDSIDRSFFAGIFSIKHSGTGNYAYNELVRPYRIIVSKNDANEADTFYIRYNNYDSYQLKAECDKAIVQILKKGAYVGASSIDYNNVFSQNTSAILYEYKFSMPSSAFCNAYSVSGNNIVSKLKNFDAVAILPLVSESKKLTVFFLDYTAQIAYEYSVSNYNGCDSLSSYITEELNLPHTMSYYMPGLINEAVAESLFAPYWSGKEILYTAVRAEKPYAENGSLTRRYIEKKISSLFDNPGLMTSDAIDNVYTYRDDYTVVKYWPENVLEYTNYKTPGVKGENSFLSSFSAAIDIIKRDEEISNEYYLSEYKLADDTWSFYFDFTANNFPVAMPQVMKSKINMNYAIEISVVNDMVVKYKKLAYNFITDEFELLLANRGFIEAYTGANGSVDFNSDMRISKADLAYSADEKITALKLAWFFETEYGTNVTIPSTYPAKME